MLILSPPSSNPSAIQLLQQAEAVKYSNTIVRRKRKKSLINKVEDVIDDRGSDLSDVEPSEKPETNDVFV